MSFKSKMDNGDAVDAHGVGGQGTGSDAWLVTDNVHPSQAGHYAIGDEAFDVVFA